MSHFPVLVQGNVESQLAPYNEETPVAPYVDMVYEDVLDELIGRASEPQAGVWWTPERVALADTLPRIIDPSHKLFNEYRAIVSDYYGALVGTNGDRYTVYNPKSQWDWYSIGGRWAGLLTTTEGVAVNKCRKGSLDVENSELPSFAIVVNGEGWVDSGQMHFFGVVVNPKDTEVWKKEFFLLFNAIPEDDVVTLVDCHI